MIDLSTVVELPIAKILPNKYILIFDGWSTTDAHYVAIFANYLSFKAWSYEKVRLGFSPLE